VFNEELPKLESNGDKAFWGWSQTESYEAGSEPILTASGANMTLYALFGNKITLRYNYINSEGKDRGVYKEIAVMGDDDAPSDLGRPVRPDYYFGGWYTDAACTTEFNADSAAAGSFTLYAKWTAATSTAPSDPSDGNQTETPVSASGGCGAITPFSSSGFGGGVGVIAICAALTLIALRRRKTLRATRK
jgi:uncharacterized repeat protein (TIGR02543 family)